jgi:2-methylisocitrate lyase-like PEP mutase family enzyme
MDSRTADKVATFKALHAPGEFLILANAWDAGSARLIESCGAPAVATSSAALDWSCGYADGGTIPQRVLAEAVRRISRVLTVPLTVDSENGYSDDPAEVADTVSRLWDAGATGINIEDGAQSPELLARKIEAIKSKAARAGAGIFVNARTDVVLRNLVPPDEAVGEIARRADIYKRAGCDGLFVPRLGEPAAIRAVVAAIDPLPLNLMAVPGLPAVEDLRPLGVRRLSAGSALAEAVLGFTKKLASTFLDDGRSDGLFTPENLTWSGLNALFSQK